MACIQIMYYSTFALHQIFLVPGLCVNLWRYLKNTGHSHLKELQRMRSHFIGSRYFCARAKISKLAWEQQNCSLMLNWAKLKKWYFKIWPKISSVFFWSYYQWIVEMFSSISDLEFLPGSGLTFRFSRTWWTAVCFCWKKVSIDHLRSLPEVGNKVVVLWSWWIIPS